MISSARPIYQLANIASNLVDVSLQNVMAQLQCLLSVQLPFLSAEPEGQESVTAPYRQRDGWRNKSVKTSFFLLLSTLTLSLAISYLGSQRNLSS